ncbi:MAG: thiamine ABC transporter substrate-binding protein [Cetobacterium sp.]
MKKLLSILFLGTSICLMADEVVVYGPSSMKWVEKDYGPIFEKNTGHKIKFISVDGLVPRMKLEKVNPKSDVVLGLTQVLGEVAKEEKLISKYVPKNLDKIANDKYSFDKEGYITPFDYGFMAINYNSENLKEAPKTLEEIGKIKNSLIIEDPRSATGQELLFWSYGLYGKNWMKFWETLKPSIASVAPGWTEAFGKFTGGEAPMMTGYATSSIFFYMDGAENKYKSFIPEDGGYVYLEGAALTKKKKIKDGAKEFMDSILTNEFQDLVAEKNYMFPVTHVELPETFKYVPSTDKVVILSQEDVKELSKNLESYRKELLEFLKK